MPSIHTLFRMADVKRVGDKEYTTYAVRDEKYAHSMLVLFGDNGKTPLLALVFVSSSAKPSLLMRRSAPPNLQAHQSDWENFQGIVTESDKPFQFFVANLHSNGSIRFQLLGEDDKAVNEINLIDGCTYVPIEADYRHGNKQMILSKQLKATSTRDKPEYATVQDAESKENQTSGAIQQQRFQFVCTPESRVKSLCDSFRGGLVWKCVPAFVTVTNAPPPPSAFTRGPPVPRAERGYIQPQAGTIDYAQYAGAFRDCRCDGTDSVSRRSNIRCFGDVRRSRSNIRYFADVHSATDSVPRRSNNNRLLGDVRPQNQVSAVAAFGPAYIPESFSVPSDSADSCPEEEDVESCAMPQSSPLGAIDVQSSFAGKLNHGLTMTVDAQTVECDLDMTLTSTGILISLSILETMKLEPLNIQAIITELLDNTTKEQAQALIPKKQYKSEFCVLDLESPANVILAQCGHQCINVANVDKLKNSSNRCPICRGHIAAYLTDDGTLLC